MNASLPINEEEMGPMGRAVMRLGVLSYGLAEDRMWVAEQLDSDNEAGSARRAYIRIMLTFIEGMTHALKDLLLSAAECNRVSLDEAEVNVLREVQFQLDGKYRAKVVHRPIRVKDDVRFTLLRLGRCSDQPFQPNFGDQGWQAFLEAISIRNRITHPQSRDDHWVTEDNIKRVDQAVKWFEDETTRFLQHFELDFLYGAKANNSNEN